MRVIDTNVLVYHLIGQSGDLSARSSELFHRLKSDVESAYMPVTAIFECVYACQTMFRVPNDVLADLLLEIMRFPGVVMNHLGAMVKALELWQTQGPLSFADCYHLALTKELGMTQIYTFDKKMDRYPGVERIEP
jgi:predicted nucleic acid-binding protein